MKQRKRVRIGNEDRGSGNEDRGSGNEDRGSRNEDRGMGRRIEEWERG